MKDYQRRAICILKETAQYVPKELKQQIEKYIDEFITHVPFSEHANIALQIRNIILEKENNYGMYNL